MNSQPCTSQSGAQCSDDLRRALVRAGGQLAGVDYVEVYPDGLTLCVRFFGQPPAGLDRENLLIEGGERITGIQVTDAEFEQHEDGDVCLRVSVDRTGDFSSYCLCLIEPERRTSRCSDDPLPAPVPRLRPVPAGIDPRYACAAFSFRIDCPSDLDCLAPPCATPPAAPAPAIDYLARDFNSFRRLLLDRMSSVMPDWRERHLPDLGVTVVEVLAYIADQFSYTLDAVATEAYLGTARRRISVRRHARLLDYRMHEGCNARAWLTVETSAEIALPLSELVFAAPPPQQQVVVPGLKSWRELQRIDQATLFQAIDLGGDGKLHLSVARNEIHFYTWHNQGCCLPAGATNATLRDSDDTAPDEEPRRTLHLAAGDVLIFEEIRSGVTGSGADADPARRHAVRLTGVTELHDPLDRSLLLDIEWDRADALPWALCLSARTAAPDCRWVECAVARGNVVLVDHGIGVERGDDSWVVGEDSTQGCCACDGMAADITSTPAPFNPTLARDGLTWAVPLPTEPAPATSMLTQDPRQALPQLRLDRGWAVPPDSSQIVWEDSYGWHAVPDLLASERDDQVFVTEVDDEGYAHLRFGSGDDGRVPPAHSRFRARYRIGNGAAGNVGHDTIVWIAVRNGLLSGVELHPRNPMAATGGREPEPVADVKQYAPRAYGRVLERAIAAADYAEIAANDARIQGAYAELVWSGSWYEAAVALDRYASAADDPLLETQTQERLQMVRRIGHDLRLLPALRVPLRIAMDICVAPGAIRAEVKRALSDALSNRRLADGKLGLFHEDRLQFGQDIRASVLVALAQQTEGVAHVTMVAFARADAATADAQRTLADGLLPIAADEIAQLDGNPDFPERGTLTLNVRGGR
ncbi:putative baseplate assembly protein [Rugamonas sp. FT82W]|uniref:Putative baseplate assembly protein n=1 Tax=Duganella vulcania TaxID=2692166 RepID=A0A845GDI1_9BURK|nr:putative baseplate assembly protein [Duganella vulcania]MYM90998.1 putative baseplate assembly protein [Duganella vulcania]